ncbi:MAG: hypothetical protein JNG89_21040 [Planctomycetaceae bacterium]|nr:hypothetical protein [Planctomycetaceae bacterium]
MLQADARGVEPVSDISLPLGGPLVAVEGQPAPAIASSVLSGSTSSLATTRAAASRSVDLPLFRLRGRIDSDFIWVDQSASNVADFGSLSDTVGLRRARIGGEGHLADDVRYIGEIDLATGDVVLRDGYLGIGNLRRTGEFRFGHFREPFSLEGNTSANSFAFMERSPVNHLDPARNWGVAYFRCNSNEDATFAAGVFQSGTDASDVEFGPGSDTAATMRLTIVPWWNPARHRLVHAGVALSARVPNDGIVSIGEGPNSPLLDFGDSSTSPFVSTISVPADFQQLFNAQGAYTDGRLTVQAEWYGTIVDQDVGAPLLFHGSYIQGSYFLAGGRREYERQQGVFGAVNVDNPVLPCFSSSDDRTQRGWGAWEATARCSYLDFLDSDTPPGPQGQIVGVRMPQFACGINWYLADRLRILVNYTLAVPDEPNTGTSTASLLAMRLGVFW